MVPADLKADEARLARTIVCLLAAAAAAAATGVTICVVISLLIPRPSALPAVIIGVLTGTAVHGRYRGASSLSGAVAALATFLGCVAAKLIIVWLDLSRTNGIPLLDVATGLSPLHTLRLSARPGDTLFYSLSVLAALLLGSWPRPERR